MEIYDLNWYRKSKDMMVFRKQDGYTSEVLVFLTVRSHILQQHFNLFILVKQLVGGAVRNANDDKDFFAKQELTRASWREKNGDVQIHEFRF